MGKPITTKKNTIYCTYLFGMIPYTAVGSHRQAETSCRWTFTYCNFKFVWISKWLEKIQMHFAGCICRKPGFYFSHFVLLFNKVLNCLSSCIRWLLVQFLTFCWLKFNQSDFLHTWQISHPTTWKKISTSLSLVIIVLVASSCGSLLHRATICLFQFSAGLETHRLSVS